MSREIVVVPLQCRCAHHGVVVHGEEHTMATMIAPAITMIAERAGCWKVDPIDMATSVYIVTLIFQETAIY